MVKYNCIVIDDEAHSIEGLKKYIDSVPFLNLVKTYLDPVQALMELSNADKVDLILMDIDMPMITGIELSKQLREKTNKLIFTTGHTQYGYEAFEVSADAYLLKPYSLTKFIATISKLFPDQKSEPNKSAYDYFFVKNVDDSHKLVKVNYRDLIAVESRQNYVMIYAGDQKILTYMSLTEAAELLAGVPNFVKYHRSFIVNNDHIASVSGNMLRMANGLQVTVGDNYRKEFTDYMDRKLLKAGRKI